MGEDRTTDLSRRLTPTPAMRTTLFAAHTIDGDFAPLQPICIPTSGHAGSNLRSRGKHVGI
jgi:hypothetical protein